MKNQAHWQVVVGALLLANGVIACTSPDTPEQPAMARFLTYTADPQRQTVALYWQDDAGRPFRSLGRLHSWLAQRGHQVRFAGNGGMYHAGNVPVGLYIEKGRMLAPLNTSRGAGNFYLKPNGVFYLTAQRRAGLCPTDSFASVPQVQYATQSGPMLVLNGHLHPAFGADSRNRQIRNGVGVLPDGRVLLVLSREKVTFYELTRYFQARGCRNALYLDGFVSRAYLPAQGWRQTDGDFGVMIAVTEESSPGNGGDVTLHPADPTLR